MLIRNMIIKREKLRPNTHNHDNTENTVPMLKEYYEIFFIFTLEQIIVLNKYCT